MIRGEIEESDYIHVYPLFGKEHETSIDCWCCPEFDEEEPTVVIHHQEN